MGEKLTLEDLKSLGIIVMSVGFDKPEEKGETND